MRRDCVIDVDVVGAGVRLVVVLSPEGVVVADVVSVVSGRSMSVVVGVVDR
ncbi:hypothetical protein [Mycolicibacterium llatzerense]|uniref:hypothetical protein n=1 Tax=Mycolicibacterium llatzerense TaxID=280871 RepID=UPI0013A6D750|nr:hypothetical protein [Mycolicibacterium llatzerense]